MPENSKIEWTDHTWNPWRGCAEATLPDGSKHPGCDHCYAREMAKRNPAQLGTWGPGGLRVRAAERTFRSPLLWNRRVMQSSGGLPERVFVDSMSDFFEDRDDLAPWRRDAFEIIEQCQNLRFIIATKRPQNIRPFWPHDGFARRVMAPSRYGLQNCDPTPRRLPNVIVLASISNQKTADELVPPLIDCGDFVDVGLSVEPLLGPIHLPWLHLPKRIITPQSWPLSHTPVPNLKWVIVGGESGHRARPMHIGWTRSIRSECQANQVPFFFKQWGEWGPYDGDPGRCEVTRLDREGRDVTGLHGLHDETDVLMTRYGKATTGRLLDGREWNEFPNI